MPRKKLWKFTAGPYGARARVAELTWGGSVYVFAYDAGRKFPRRKSLRFAVRDAEGKIIPEAEERAKREAVELSNKLIMGESLAKEITLDELFGLFRREVVSSMGARNRDEMERELELWTNFLGSRFPIAKLGTAEWNALVRQRVSGEIDGRGKRFKDPKERRVVGPRTVAKSLKALRQVCRFGASYHLQSGTFLLVGDPTRGLEIPREPNPKAPIADHARFQKLLEVADQVTIRMPGWKHLPSGKRVPCWKRVPTYLRELLVIAEGTGRRIGAILALRYSDWDTEAPRTGRCAGAPTATR